MFKGATLFRPVQIVLRLYQSPAEILTGFDIDAACCGYDGECIFQVLRRSGNSLL